jgi:hypothetical protein
MRKPGHNALDRTLMGVPRDYFSNPNGFGTPSAGRAVLPAWGNLYGQQVAIVQLQLVRQWLSGGREPSSSCLGATFGFSRSTWSRVVTGRRWAGSIGFAALVAQAVAQSPRAGDLDEPQRFSGAGHR